MAIFRFFKMAAAAILDLQNFKFLNAGAVKGVELHQRAKFCENPLNCGRNMAIFRFYQDGGRPPSWICNACLGPPRSAFGGLYHCAKFGWNRCSSFENMEFFRFRDLKT